MQAILLLSAMIAFPMHSYPAHSRDTITDSWAPNDTQKRYKSLAEERFSMECDYLGIDGQRTRAARELFETMLVARRKVDSERSRRIVTRSGAIEAINKIDLAYYLELKELVSGRRNLDRIGRMIVKVRARNGSRAELSAHID